MRNLFRVMHSINGGAGFLGLHADSRLARDLESLLSLIRDGQLTPEPDLVDALLAGPDRLNVLLKSPDMNSEERITEIRTRLRRFLNPTASESPEFYPDAGKSCQAEFDDLKPESDDYQAGVEAKPVDPAHPVDDNLELHRVYELT